MLQALSTGMAEYRNDSIRLFSKLVKLGQGIHLPHLLVDEMRAMAQDAGTDGGARLLCCQELVYADGSVLLLALHIWQRSCLSVTTS